MQSVSSRIWTGVAVSISYDDNRYTTSTPTIIIIIIVNIIAVISLLASFSHQSSVQVFHWSLNDNKSPQISRTLLSIQTDLIIIIMSCRWYGYPWHSLATSPYRSSPSAGLQGYISYPHIVAVCMFELVVLLLLGHMWGSIEVHHLRARPCFSSSVMHVWFV